MASSKLYPRPSFFYSFKIFLRGMSVPIAIFSILILTSSILFNLVEGGGLLNAIYFTVITITTVGFGDITPKTEIGKIITMLTLVIGILSLSFASRYLIDYIVKNRDQKYVDSLIINQLENHIIIVGFNSYLLTTAKILETLNIPSVFLIPDSNSLPKNHSEFIVVQNESFILDTIKNMNLNKAKGLLIDATEEDGTVITLLTLREEYKALVITVLTDDEDLSTLFTTAKNVDFIYKPSLLGYTIKNELLGLKIQGEYRIRLKNDFEMQEIPISTTNLEKEIANTEIKGIQVIGFVSHAFNELTLRKDIKQVTPIFDGIIKNTKKEESLFEGKLLVFGDKIKLQEIVSSHTSRKKIYDNVLVLADENLDSVDLIIPSLKTVSKNIQFFIPDINSSDYIKGLSKIRALNMPIRTGNFSSEYKDSELKKFDLAILMLQSPTKALGIVFHFRRVSQTVKIWCNNSDPKAHGLFHNSGADFVFATDDSLALGSIDPYVNVHTYSNAVLVVPEIQGSLLTLGRPSIGSIVKKYVNKAKPLLVWNDNGDIHAKIAKRKRLGKDEQILLFIDRFD